MIKIDMTIDINIHCSTCTYTVPRPCIYPGRGTQHDACACVHVDDMYMRIHDVVDMCIIKGPGACLRACGSIDDVYAHDMTLSGGFKVAISTFNSGP